MERSSYKKSLLLRLYLKALITTPYVYKCDRKNIKSHRNTLTTLNTLLFNKQYDANIFSCFEEQNENDFIATNIEVFDSYKSYNELIININPEELSYIDVVTNLRDLLEKQKNDTDITYDEMLELANSYYNSIPDKEIRNVFNKVYIEKDNNIIIDKESSLSFLMPTIDYSLILLGKNNETYKNMLFDLIHEYGHTIQTKINRDLLFYEKEYQPAELMPVFFNMLSLFYFDDSLGTNIEKNIIQMQTSLFLDQVKYTKEIKEYGLKAFKEKYNETAIDIYFDHSSLQVYSYLIPMLTSFELIQKYKQDPEKSMYILKKLIMNNKDYIDLLSDYNINLGEYTNETIKMLKK